MDYVYVFLGALMLFQGWLVVIFVIAAALCIIGLVLRRGMNRRMAIIGLLPFVAGSFTVALMMMAPTMAVSMLWVLLSDGGAKIPPPGIDVLALAELVFVAAFTIFVVLYLPRVYGLPLFETLERVSERARFAVLATMVFGVIFIGSLIAHYRGPYSAFAVFLILVYGVGITYMLLKSLAVRRFIEAPQLSSSIE